MTAEDVSARSTGATFPRVVPGRLRLTDTAICGLVLVVAVVLGTALGPVTMSPWAVFGTLLDHVPGITIDTSLSAGDVAIIEKIRFPRVILAAMVGATLAMCGAAYQGVFRNPLADPYLLGAAAGAGLGATIAIGLGWSGDSRFAVPALAFIGSLGAVMLTYVLGGTGAYAGSVTLVLAGVAVAAFLSAVQTFLLQRSSDSLREVYSWILGNLSTTGWSQVLLLLPYAGLSTVVLVLSRRVLDVLALGDDEARMLGMRPQLVRLLIVVAASVGTAAAVSVSGLIGFVGLIVPHVTRMIFGPSFRSILPLSALLGGALLVLTDIGARTIAAPAEIPIGVITAFLGAPFFALLLRTSRSQR